MVFDPDNPKHEAPCTCHGDQNGIHFCPMHRGKVDPIRVVNLIRSEAQGTLPLHTRIISEHEARHTWPSAGYVCAAEERAKKAEAANANLCAGLRAIVSDVGAESGSRLQRKVDKILADNESGASKSNESRLAAYAASGAHFRERAEKAEVRADMLAADLAQAEADGKRHKARILELEAQIAKEEVHVYEHFESRSTSTALLVAEARVAQLEKWIGEQPCPQDDCFDCGPQARCDICHGTGNLIAPPPEEP